jgi:hypothetical protein
MSWSLEIVGTKDACCKAIANESYLPPWLAESLRTEVAACAEVVDKRNASWPNQKFAVHVKTYGHVDGVSYQNESRVQPIRVE